MGVRGDSQPPFCILIKRCIGQDIIKTDGHSAIIRGMTIGEQIRELRKARKLTQTELARMTGVTHWTVQHIEVGKRKPSNPVLERLCGIFDVKVVLVPRGKGNE